MVDSIPLPSGATNLKPVEPTDASSGDASVDTMVVGISSGAPSTGLTVGNPGLAASADSGEVVDASSAPANPFPPMGSSGGTVVGSGETLVPGGAADGVVAGDSATSATPGSQAPITDADADGNGPIGASSTPAVTLGAPLTNIGGANDPESRAGSGGVTTDTVSVPGSGLVFKNTFATGVSTAFQDNIITAEQDLAGLWTNSVTLNLHFKAVNKGINGELAFNNWPSFVDVTYAQLTGALTSHATSTYALAAVAALPATDPNPAGGADWALPEAYARMLGLSSRTPTFDDTITLNTSYSWSFGQDVVNTMEHEISEGGMGRVGGLGDQNGVWSAMDLFRYTSGGVPDYTDGRDGQTTYFSYNGGTTLSLSVGLSFNNEFNSSDVKVNSGDTADFTEQDVFGTGDPGETNTLSLTDIEMIDVLGWNPSCFCRGTLILGERGEVAVEDLLIGDRLITLSGAARPIKWIGRRAYDGRFIAANRMVLPIRVAAGALAQGVPARDLWVSPEHALYTDGALVPAGLLVNGATIRQVECVYRLEYFHIELEGHDVILAEGAPAETYVDCDNRFMFHNGAEFTERYPDDLPATWDFCAPRAGEGSAGLAAIRAMLSERLQALGYDPSEALAVASRSVVTAEMELAS
jgi:hypothetical protein